MKKRTSLVAILFVVPAIALACWVKDDNYCPLNVNVSGMTCTLTSGEIIPWVAPANEGQSGLTDYVPYGFTYCTYHCPDGTNHSYYPGAAPFGDGCIG